jgi:hypothetical protein
LPMISKCTTGCAIRAPGCRGAVILDHLDPLSTRKSSVSDDSAIH